MSETVEEKEPEDVFAWHEADLRQTEADLAAGRLEILDWEDAKRTLWELFNKA